MDRNLDLKSEYEALQKHSLLLTQQNRDLQRELDQFVETDDIVRRNLDRKDKVYQIRSKVDNAIHQSTHIVARQRSPVREIVEVTQVKERYKSPYNYAYPGSYPVPDYNPTQTRSYT